MKFDRKHAVAGFCLLLIFSLSSIPTPVQAGLFDFLSWDMSEWLWIIQGVWPFEIMGSLGTGIPLDSWTNIGRGELGTDAGRTLYIQQLICDHATVGGKAVDYCGFAACAGPYQSEGPDNPRTMCSPIIVLAGESSRHLAGTTQRKTYFRKRFTMAGNDICDSGAPYFETTENTPEDCPIAVCSPIGMVKCENNIAWRCDGTKWAVVENCNLILDTYCVVENSIASCIALPAPPPPPTIPSVWEDPAGFFALLFRAFWEWIT